MPPAMHPKTGSIDRKTFESWLNHQNLSPAYKRDIGRRISDFLSKSICENPLDCVTAIRDHARTHSAGKYDVLAFRALLRFLEHQGLAEVHTAEVKRLLKHRKSNPDMFVPNDDQLRDTLARLSQKNQLLFKIYMATGLRKNEGEYLYANIGRLKVQQCEGFVKVNLASYRKTKTAFFAYLPTWLYEQVCAEAATLSVRSLDNFTTTHKLIAPKYVRKWFYTKCVELGIPESVADFYQGRNSQTIGSRHYLAKQVLADKFYPLHIAYLPKVCKS